MNDHNDPNNKKLEEWVDEKMHTLGQDGEWRPDSEDALGRFRERTASKPRWKGFGLAAVVAGAACVVVLALPWQVLWNRVSQGQRGTLSESEETVQVVETEGPIEHAEDTPPAGTDTEIAIISPDGQWIAYVSDGLLYRRNVEVFRIEAGTGQGEGQESDSEQQCLRQVFRQGVLTCAEWDAGPGVGEGTGQDEGADAGEEVLRIGGGVSSPSVISQVQPEYSQEAREAEYEGIVVLEAIIHSDGSTEIVRVVRSLGFGLDQKAIEALQQWKFRPAMRGGEAVAVSLNIEVNFNLRD